MLAITALELAEKTESMTKNIEEITSSNSSLFWIATLLLAVLSSLPLAIMHSEFKYRNVPAVVYLIVFVIVYAFIFHKTGESGGTDHLKEELVDSYDSYLDKSKVIIDNVKVRQFVDSETERCYESYTFSEDDYELCKDVVLVSEDGTEYNTHMETDILYSVDKDSSYRITFIHAEELSKLTGRNYNLVTSVLE